MTTQKKYELTDEFITLLGKKLYRIKALIAFGDVDAGDIGGYIESEDNLSHEGDAKVYGDAQVFGNAWVYGNVGSENGTLTVFNGKDGLIVTRGCFEGTVDEFLQKSAEVHDEKINREYTLLIEVAKSRILG